MLIEGGKLILNNQFDWLILFCLVLAFAIGISLCVFLSGEKARKKTQYQNKEKSPTELLNDRRTD